VPVTLTVELIAGVSLTGEPSGIVLPGEVADYALALTNTGNTTDTFALTLDSQWPTTLSHSEVTLAAGAGTTITASVTAPAGALAGASDMTEANATSQNDDAVSAAFAFTTTVGAVYAPSLAPDLAQEVFAGNEVTYTLVVTNTGNITDTIVLSVDSSWSSALSPANVTLGVGESTDVTATLQAPADAATGAVPATVSATSSGDETQVATATLTTTVVLPLWYLPLLLGR
jgi:uncharacterized membrane protein